MENEPIFVSGIEVWAEWVAALLVRLYPQFSKENGGADIISPIIRQQVEERESPSVRNAIGHYVAVWIRGAQGPLSEIPALVTYHFFLYILYPLNLCFYFPFLLENIDLKRSDM